MPNPIQVKRADVVEEVRALAGLLRVSLTDAIGQAVKAKLVIEQARAKQDREKRLKRAAKALAELHRLPVVGPTLTDDDFYDEEGLPK